MSSSKLLHIAAFVKQKLLLRSRNRNISRTTMDIDEQALIRAIYKTFDKCNTLIPATDEIIAFSSRFYNDNNKNIQWKAFIRKKLIAQTAITLKEICLGIKSQLDKAFEDILRSNNGIF